MELPELSAVFAAHDVAVAYLFGSQAEGTAIAADGYRVPRDYGDAFRVLAEVGVLDGSPAGWPRSPGRAT